ncbi:MAG: glycoside hydrolase family 3 N-terminal domain-containing protein [Frankiaceae bacterium]
MDSWSVSRQAAQVVTVPVEGTSVGQVSGSVRLGVGGVLLFGNRAPADLRGQLRALTAQAPGGIKPFVMSDEEGGGVQRLRNLVGELPWARSLAATRTPAQVRLLAADTARRLLALGVDMDLAPVLDLDAGPGPDARHPAGRRSFSSNPAVAARYGTAFAAGLRDGGVVAVVKHFPGLGSASYNTDFGSASVSSLARLQRADLTPFRAAIAAGVPAVMVSHARVPGLSALPASLSAEAVGGLLRGRLGFHGLVVTDSLSAEAVRAAGFGVTAGGVRALQAGSDLLLYGPAGAAAPRTARELIAAVVEAVRSGQLPASRLRDAVRHILAAKHVAGC